LSAHIHPGDRVRAAFRATRAIVGPCEIGFRSMLDREICWIVSLDQGADADICTMLGALIDVTGRTQAKEGHELLAGEMSHRVKILLAIVTGLTALTSRSSATTVEMAGDITQGLSAFGRAHDLIRPIPGQEG
jgi:hypothetical protein